MGTVPIYNTGTLGIIKDVKPHLLPPEAWSDGNNMRMEEDVAKRFSGYAQVFGTPNVAPGFVFYVPSTNNTFWLYANLTSVHVYDGVSHTDITRAAGGTPYTATNLRDWNGCLLAGVPILNNGADVPQFWPTLSPGVDLSNLTNWTATLRAKVIRNFGRFLVALNLNDNGTLLPHAVQWSHPADPGTIPPSWDFTNAAVDAGRTHLTDTEGGVILDAKLLANYLVIYKENSCHLMRFVGGNDIMGFDLLLDNGLLAPRCVTIFDAGTKHFCVSKDNVYTHSATRNADYPLDKKDRRYLFADMDSVNFVNAFAFENPSKEEVWFAYPSSGATFPNKALVYSYRKGNVAFKDFLGLSASIGTVPVPSGGTWATASGSWDAQVGPWNETGVTGIVTADPANTKLWQIDKGTAFGTSSTRSFLQRTGFAIVGKDRSGAPKADFWSTKLFKRIWPKIRGTAVVEARMGVQEEFDGTVTWTPYKTFDPQQKYLDFEIQGRLGAIEYQSFSDQDWQIEGHDIELEIVGNM